MTTLRALFITAVLLTTGAYVLLGVISEGSTNYSANISSAASQKLENVNESRAALSGEIQTIQGELNQIKEGDTIQALLGAPGALIAAIKILLISFPNLVQDVLETLLSFLHLPVELIVSISLIIFVFVVFKIISIWAKGGEI